MMKPFVWNDDKNLLLKAQRNISFEEIVFHIQAGDLLDVLDHPNQVRYPDQKIYVLFIEDYVYLVPHIESEHEIFLKTIIPSRKATRHYGAQSNR